MTTTAGDRPGSLEEYKFLTSQAQEYLRNRIPLTTFAYSVSGALLGLSHTMSSEVVTIALVLVELCSALLACECTLQAVRRLTFVRVFLESSIPGLAFQAALEYEIALPNAVVVERLGPFGHTRLRLTPYEFAYALLAAAGLTYAVVVWLRGGTPWAVWIAVAGAMVLLPILLQTRHINSSAGMQKYVCQWLRVKAAMESGPHA